MGASQDIRLLLARSAMRMAAVICAAALGACGGGDEASAPEEPAASIASVVIEGGTVDTFESRLVKVDDVVVSAVLKARWQGPQASLFAVTLEDDAGLFELRGEPSAGDTVGSFRVTLWGVSTEGKAGRFVGAARLRVHLDGQEVHGSPILVPYDVQIRPGLRFTRRDEPVRFLADFGQLPASAALALDAPEGTSISAAWIQPSPRLASPAATAEVSSAGPPYLVRVSPILATPGTRDFAVLVFAEVRVGQRSYPLRAELPATYQVNAVPGIDALISPSRFELQARVGGDASAGYTALYTGTTWNAFDLEVEYVPGSPADGTSDASLAWLSPACRPSCAMAASSCYWSDGVASPCMSPGLYRARVYVLGTVRASNGWTRISSPVDVFFRVVP